ncbi:MAG: prepilin-type N-terminal cleavage/methylation domain-containing protein [Desulfobacterales bacterium]|jgi:general secretion pathway protein I|nr:prepilin-type N-terminal cleavage/methylation domain-containing protein [Desulfobacterales bacterium]
MVYSISRYRKTQPKVPGFSFGFTLLEVMVALAVMSIVLVSVYRMHSQSLAMNTAVRFYTQAPMLAQSKMVEIEALSSNAFPEDSGDFGEEFPGYGWKAAITDVTSEILGEVAEDLKQVDITVSLNENQFIYNLRTYRFQRD